VSRGSGTGRTTLQDLTLRPIGGRQVAVRTEATNLCYSNTGVVLGLGPNFGGRLSTMALIQGHGGVGIVEAVGPEVRRAQVGDRVCVSGTPQCGACYQCLRGRADMCQFLGRQGPDDLVPIAEMRDGTPVYANSHIGGLAEVMVTFEEWVVPIFTKANAAELGMVCSCVSVAGLGATTAQSIALVEPGSIVAVVGCGPLGLSGVQGARIAGASTIIAIDPVRARREVALKVGATHTLDPNVEGDKLVERVRDLSKGPNNRLWAGGRDSGGLLGGAGADFVLEAAGADQARPKVEAGPDPTGILPLRQAYEMCAPGGHIVTTSLPRGNLTLPAVLFTIGGRTHHAGQAGGANPMRDIPRFVELLDKGQYNAKALATTVVPIERMLEAYEDVVYRTTVTAIMTA
jgi:S-(hydroxymethyl)glutathione dehydrogenase/alcohol dehydrogenase